MTLAAGSDGRLRVLVSASGIGTADAKVVAKFLPAPVELEGRWVALEGIRPEPPPARRRRACKAGALGAVWSSASSSVCASTAPARSPPSRPDRR